MTQLDRLKIFFYGFLLFVVGASVLLVSFPFLSAHCAQLQCWVAYLSKFTADGIVIKSFGGILTLMGFSLIHTAFAREKRLKELELKTEKGVVRVVLSAIEDYVRRSIVRIPEIKDIKTKIEIKGKGLKITAKLILAVETNSVTNIADNVQKDIENSVLDLVGYQIPIITNINVVRIDTVSNASSASSDFKAEPGEPPLPPDSFDGIQY